MQLILGMTLRGNDAEVFDDDTPGGESYSFMGVQTAINEGRRRMQENPDILE